MILLDALYRQIKFGMINEIKGGDSQSFGRSKTKRSIGQQTPQEQRLQTSQADLSEEALEAVQKQSEFQDRLLADLDPALSAQNAAEAEARARAEGGVADQDQLLQQQIARLEAGTAATPEQRRLITLAADNAIAAGSSDISSQARDLARVIREEIAPSLGLRPEDTPNFDRGARVASEATRQTGQLVRDIRGQAASAELNFPLASFQAESGANLATENLQGQREQFQQELAQRAFSNRLNLTNQISSGGLGIAEVASRPFFPQADQGFVESTGTRNLSRFGEVNFGAG